MLLLGRKGGKNQGRGTLEVFPLTGVLLEGGRCLVAQLPAEPYNRLEPTLSPAVGKVLNIPPPRASPLSVLLPLPPRPRLSLLMINPPGRRQLSKGTMTTSRKNGQKQVLHQFIRL